jgi:hypothetical protein
LIAGASVSVYFGTYNYHLALATICILQVNGIDRTISEFSAKIAEEKRKDDEN